MTAVLILHPARLRQQLRWMPRAELEKLLQQSEVNTATLRAIQRELDVRASTNRHPSNVRKEVNDGVAS